MRVELDGGEVISLGVTETAPTIGIIDYSRRVTDDFGVTTVVERGFARRMSVRMMVPFDDADALVRRLADLRATPARWVASDDLSSLSVRGFYKDFTLDLAVPPASFCTLTVEGLTDGGAFVDPGTDPATDGRTSTLQLLQPIVVTDAVLTATNIAEADYPEWAAGVTYALGARVIKAATHRIYESAAAGNVGNDPAGASGKWSEVGATNRWAMFDEALGSQTIGAGSIIVTLDPVGAVNALALLDVTAASVRVQAAGYDRTIAPGSAPGSALFLDMPATAGAITVTVTGAGVVSVGTLLLGSLVGLGITEASPTASILDFSRKETDDFGEVTVVERAWAKKMSAAALIRTDAVDVVAGRIAAVRARPSLWIGDEALDSITVFGFFKDFSIEVGESVSKLSLSIEGLSTAAAVAPLIPSIITAAYLNDAAAPATPARGSGTVPPGWSATPQALAAGQYRWLSQAEFRGDEQLTDWSLPVKVAGTSWGDVINDGGKPADNATVGAPAGTPVGDLLAEQVKANLDLNALNILAEMTTAGTWRGETDEIIYMPDGRAVRTAIQQLGTTVDGHTLYITSLQEVNGSTGTAKFVFAANADGTIVGIEGLAGGGFDRLAFMASKFVFVDNSGTNPVQALTYEGGVWKLKAIECDTLKVNTAVIPVRARATSSVSGSSGGSGAGWADIPTSTVLTAVVTMTKPGWIEVDARVKQDMDTDNRGWHLQLEVNGDVLPESSVGGGAYQDSVPTDGSYYASTAGDYVCTLSWGGQNGDVRINRRTMKVRGFPDTE